MAIAASASHIKESLYTWEGRDRSGKQVRGELRASGENVVSATLRRQGILVTKVKKRTLRSGKKITDKDITLFTRQLATMMKAGVPLLQSFDIVAKGHANPSVSKLIQDIRGDVETGTSLNQAFRKFPLYFDPLFCNLVGAGEQAGILEDLLTLAGEHEVDEVLRQRLMLGLVERRAPPTAGGTRCRRRRRRSHRAGRPARRTSPAWWRW